MNRINSIFSIYFKILEEKLKNNKQLKKEELLIIKEKVEYIKKFKKEIIDNYIFDLWNQFFVKQIKLYFYEDIEKILKLN